MRNQVEEIILLPTNEGKERRKETDVFHRVQNSSNDYPANGQQRNALKR